MSKKKASSGPMPSNTTAAGRKTRSSNSSAKEHLKSHPILRDVFPPLTPNEIDAVVERVKLYGQKESIEVLDGLVVAGWAEYLACFVADLTPKLTTIAKPPCIVEYIIRRNVPRHLSTLDRACIAVLAQEQFRKLTKERMRQAGSVGGKMSGQGRAETNRPFDGSNKRWFQFAARILGTTAGAVRYLAAIYKNAPDVFEAVRAGKINSMSDARALVGEMKWDHADDPAHPTRNDNIGQDRQEVLRRYEACKQSVPLKAIIFDRKREKRVAQLPPPVPNGKGYAIYTGPMKEHHGKLKDKSIDLVVADILYGEKDAPPMAREVASISKRVLVEGGLLALMAGQVALATVIEACVSEGLFMLPIGFIDYGGTSGQGLRGTHLVDHVDCDPVLFFSTTPRPNRRIVHLKFRAGGLDKRFGPWQKPTEAMMSLILAAAGKGAVVLDPCCGWGSTGEAALKTGGQFVGIELEPDRANITAGRLAEIEKALASNELTAIVQRAHKDDAAE